MSVCLQKNKATGRGVHSEKVREISIKRNNINWATRTDAQNNCFMMN